MNSLKPILYMLLLLTAGMTFVPQATAETEAIALLACPFDSDEEQTVTCESIWGCEISVGACLYGSCDINIGFCYRGNCEINVGSCYRAGCDITVGSCYYSGDCFITVGDCAYGGSCFINIGVCYGDCWINIGYCYGFFECMNQALQADTRDPTSANGQDQGAADGCVVEYDNLAPEPQVDRIEL